MSESELKKLTIKELQQKLKGLKLPSTGKKEILIERLLNSRRRFDGAEEDNMNDNENHNESGSDGEINATIIERNVSSRVRNDNGTDSNNLIRNNRSASTPFQREVVSANKYNFSPADIMNILPEFDPDDVDGLTADEWFKRVEKLRNYYKWDDALILVSIGPKLKGSARNWYNRTDDYCVEWRDFSAQFQEKFMPIINDADVHIAMSSRKRRYGENLANYLDEMIRIGAKGRLKENAIVKYFIMGMKDDDLFQAFQGQRIERLDELRDKIQWCISLRTAYYEKSKERKFQNEFKNENFRTNGSTNLVQKQESNTAIDVKIKPVKSVECYNCHQIGHYSRNCPIPSRRLRCISCNKVHKKGEPTDCPQRVALISELPSMYHKIVNINGLEIVGQIDTGSPFTLIKSDCAGRLPDVQIKCDKQFTGFLGGTCNVSRKMLLNLKLDEISVNAEVCVAENNNLPVPLLIGRNVLDQPEIRMVKENSTVLLENNLVMNIKDERKTNLRNIEETEINCGLLNIDERIELVKLINNNEELFPIDLKNLGKTDKIEMVIEMEDEKSVQQRAYRVPYAKKETIDVIVEDLIEKGIVTSSKSNYASPVLLVKKKTGEDRLCIDHRLLNAKTKMKIFQTPNIEEELQMASSYKYFTSLDLNSGYYQTPNKKEFRKYTAVVTPKGLFEFTRMPLGPKNSPTVFQQLMMKINKKRQQWKERFIKKHRVPPQYEEEDSVILATKIRKKIFNDDDSESRTIPFFQNGRAVNHIATSLK